MGIEEGLLGDDFGLALVQLIEELLEFGQELLRALLGEEELVRGLLGCHHFRGFLDVRIIIEVL